jgi:hypothetical protein
MSNSPNNENENVWEVNTEYNIKPGNYGNVKAKPGQVNYLEIVAATPKKQVKKNPYNLLGQVQLGYAGQNPKTPARKTFKVAYGGKRNTHKLRRYRKKTTMRRFKK